MYGRSANSEELSTTPNMSGDCEGALYETPFTGIDDDDGKSKCEYGVNGMSPDPPYVGLVK